VLKNSNFINQCNRHACQLKTFSRIFQSDFSYIFIWDFKFRSIAGNNHR